MDKRNKRWDLSTDALVEILVRLPPNARRRLRLVCRLWRELIDQRTKTDMQRRTKIIVVTEKGYACVVDLLTLGSETSLWQQQEQMKAGRILATCNGFVCLSDDFTAGGAITVANPLTGEVLHLPPLPMPATPARWWWWHQRYSFAYHPTTGQYKLVHVPCHLKWSWKPDVMHVLTLGEVSWREVHTVIDARCSVGSSLVNMEGMVYWLPTNVRKIMSFHLKNERIIHIEPPPVPAILSIRHLTKVHGRLAFAIGDDDLVTVWVLEGERWICQYFLDTNRLWQYKVWWREELAVPHFIYGDYFLTLGSSGELLCRYKMTEAEGSQDGVVKRKHIDQGEVVTRLPDSIYKTFAYAETKEPLSGFGA